MADTLFESWEALPFDIQLINKHIEVAPLVAQVHANTGSVIDDDEGEDRREGEGTGMDTFEVGDGCEERDHEAGMSARHVAMGERVLDVESVFVGVESEFDDLREHADGNRDEKHEV